MQPNRTAGTVRGLGLSDALRLELHRIQIPWLVDELYERRGPVEAERCRIIDGLAESHRDSTVELAELDYELEILKMMRAELSASEGDGPVAFVGPSGLVSDLVIATMQNVVYALGELTRHPNQGPEGRRQLAATTAAADAWIQTFLDCQAVIWFNLHGDADPMAAL